MFASKTPSDLSHDPFPFTVGNLRLPCDGSFNGTWTVYAPEPEFDHVQHNAPNPILVEFRYDMYHEHAAEIWLLFVNERWDGSICEASPAEIAHARRVLIRLARLAREGCGHA